MMPAKSIEILYLTYVVHVPHLLYIIGLGFVKFKYIVNNKVNH